MNTLYSHHIFFFPFKWEKEDLKGKPFEERTSIEPFRKALEKDANWKRLNPFKIDTLSNYNQYNYFHDFVRDILYDEKEKTDFLYHYAYQLPTDGTSEYQIKIKPESENGKTRTPAEILTLEIENIVLQVYKTGVGVVSFHLNNRNYSEPDTILKINQYGRRLYPPFFIIPSEKVGKPNYLDNNNFLEQLETTKGVEIAHTIAILIYGKPPAIKEEFIKYADSKNLKKNKPFLLPQFIGGLFNEKVFYTDKPEFQISPVLDDRMFVMSWFGDSNLASQLSIKSKEKYAFENDEWWYKYIFVDVKSKSCANDFMSIDLIKNATYGRWAGYGTLFGISRYSFVCLTSNLDTLKLDFVKAEFIVTHFQTIYYKMVELVLLQRACLLRFSDEVTRISGTIQQKNNDNLAEEVSSILKQYIQFVNKIYFREITAQEQGIELYNLLQKQMDIDRHVKDLNGEIQELHKYVLFLEEREQTKADKVRNVLEQNRNDRLEKLNWMAGIFAVASLILGIFGTNYFGIEKGLKVILGNSLACNDNAKSVWTITAIIFIPIILIFIFWRKIYNYFKK